LTQEKATYPIVTMCDWLNVSRSGFYEWQARPMSATAQRREYLRVHIAKYCELSHRTYGYRRIHAALVRQGEQVWSVPDFIDTGLGCQIGYFPVS
jgi:putative transposase